MTGHVRRLVVVAIVAGGAAFFSCCDEQAAEGGACRPGEQVECECDDGGVGTQVCDEQGSGWSECDCDGDGGADEDPVALGRFCHSLTYDSAATDLDLLVGEGDSAVVLTAGTWECAPPVGEDCVEIPVGSEVPVSLSSDSAGELASGTYVLQEGSAYSFEACEAQGEVYLVVLHHSAVADCHDATYTK